MSRLARTTELMRLAPHVYGAALAASRDEPSAAGVTERVLAEAVSEHVISRERLVEHAILTAVRQAPSTCFERMQRPDREAVALARLAGYSTDQVASCLGIGPREARASMLRALTDAAMQAAS